MNRRTFVYLFISLMMVALVFGSLPFAAAEPSSAPVGMTETFTPVPNTPVPSTSVPNTPVPSTPVPSTPVPAPVNAPISAPTTTPTVPAVVGLPNTGGAAPQGGTSPWILVLVASVVSSLGALAFGLSTRAHHPTRR
jgi:hypothetical protein